MNLNAIVSIKVFLLSSIYFYNASNSIIFGILGIKQITFHSLNFLNFTRGIEFIHIILFPKISNETLISVIFYNMKSEELHFYRVCSRTLKNRSNIIVKA